MPCRFYLGAAPGTIRFYWAAPAALPLPIKNVFWPWYECKAISNGPLPGIITPALTDQWEEGDKTGAAPGLGYTGTQADFLGQSSILWTPPVPTPHWLLPPCDIPVGNFLLQENGDYLLQENNYLIDLE